jgi:dipeptidyl aminopeptidase/acylaminoacyl peptidase
MKAVALLVLACFMGIACRSNATPIQFVPAADGVHYLNPHFSPDGKSLLFLQQSNDRAKTTLCIAPVATTLQITLADTEAMKGYRLPSHIGMPPWITWLPGSQQFAAIVERVGTENRPARDLWVFNTNGMLVQALFPRVNPQPLIQDAAIAPDGKAIAITTWANDNDHLYVFTNRDNATMKEVVSPDANLAGMTWADSKTLIFTASGIKDATGKMHGDFDHWQYHLDTGALTNFTQTATDNEMYPVLSADGKTLLFTGGMDTLEMDNPLAGNGINQWLAMMDISATPVAKFAPQFICSGTQPVMSPDGKMLFVY